MFAAHIRRAFFWIIVFSFLPLSACKSSYKANTGTPLNSSEATENARRGKSQQRQARAPRKGPDHLPVQPAAETAPGTLEKQAEPIVPSPAPVADPPSEPASTPEPEEIPAAPAPTPEPEKIPAAAAPVLSTATKVSPSPTAQPVTPAPANNVTAPEVGSPSDIIVNQLVVCTGVEGRNPVGANDRFTIDTSPLTGFVSLNNSGSETKITMVWVHEEKVRDRINLTVGVSKRWRTWSRKTIRRNDQGAWTLMVLDYNNKVLGSAEFVIE